MKEFLIRTISGILFVFVVISSILAHELSFLLLFLLILVFSLNEYYRLLYKIKFHPYRPASIIAGTFLFLLNYLVAAGTVEQEFLMINLAVLLMFPALPLFYSPKSFTGSLISSLSGWIYIVLPLSLVPFLAFRGKEYHPELVLGSFAVIWINDSLAYVTGTLIGKHRMFPSISPRKSWEGFTGGLILTLAATPLLAYLFPVYNYVQWGILSLVIIITGTAGDFMESALKRNARVKDSGILMPGHGGFLDRFDSFIFSISFVFLYYKLFLI